MAASTLLSVLGHPAKLAAVTAGIGGLVLTAGGVFTVLNATAGNATPQSVNAGTLKMSLGETGNGINNTVAIEAMKPGDVQNRFISLDNRGSLTGQGLTVRVQASDANKLSTDATDGLQITLTGCSVDWTADGDCKGEQTEILAATPLAELGDFVKTTVVDEVPDPLSIRVAIALPEQGECNADNADTAQFEADCVTPLKDGSIQGLTNALSFTFKETQQVAETTNS